MGKGLGDLKKKCKVLGSPNTKAVGTSGSCIVLENVLFNTVSSSVLIVHYFTGYG
jgi:hypothetical protein